MAGTAQNTGKAEDFLTHAEQLRKDAIKKLSPDEAPTAKAYASPAQFAQYSWKMGIVTADFVIGDPHGRNPGSAWDSHWQQHYGGFDDPNPKSRVQFVPSAFTPRLNPFYVALPYNDVSEGGTRPEAEKVIPWFRSTFRRAGVSICKDRWVAIRKGGRVAYAQWNDCSPYRSDHWQYVFGRERPAQNPEHGAGLWVSPAVRDCLGLSSFDVTDWKFVEIAEVPKGPWAEYGTNNPLAPSH